MTIHEASISYEAPSLERHTETITLINQYDLCVVAIDDGTQYSGATKSNKRILADLSHIGVTSITWHNHRHIHSTKPVDYTITTRN